MYGVWWASAADNAEPRWCVAFVLFRELRREETKLHWGGVRPSERCSLTKLYPGGVPPLLTLGVHSAVWYCLEDSGGGGVAEAFVGSRTAQGGQQVQREARNLIVWRSQRKQAVCI